MTNPQTIDVMDGAQYTYYAFVSHSHRDAKWAEWIWSALERYRLPSNVRKSVPRPLPKKVRPVFIDKADLGTGRLVDGLYKELRASRYLIVVCSPESAKPNAEGKHYVDTEVRHFVDLGRTDRIIPVIVAGTPEAAFCPALEEQGLLAIDATKASRRRVLNDIVAKILGLRPDELWQREQRRRTQRAIAWSMLGMCLMLMSVLGGLIAWDNCGLHIERFADYVRPYGIPQGVCPLTAEQIAHREYHYRFEYRGRRGWLGPRIVRKVTRVNSSDHQTEDNKGEFPGRPLSMRISYSDIKQTYSNLDAIDFLGRFGRVMVRFDYFGPNNQTIKLRNVLSDGSESASGRRSILRMVGGLGYWSSIVDDLSPEMPSVYGAVTTVVVKRDKLGFAESEYYFDSHEEPAVMSDGAYGRKNFYDQTGHIVSNMVCDTTGMPSVAHHGMVKRVYAYNAEGLLVRIENFATNGMVSGCQTLSQELARDKWGNVTNLCFLSSADGLLGWQYRYNSHGNCSIELPQVTPGTYRLGSAMNYDDMGYVSKSTYIDLNGNETTNRHGHASFVCVHDEFGHLTHGRTFGIGGDPCPMSHIGSDLGDFDLYGVDLILEKCGDSTTIMFLDSKGVRMCIPGSNCAGVQVAFDGYANVSQIRYCGSDLSYVDVNGISGFKYSYDILGRPEMMAAVDVNGAPKTYQNMFGGCAAARFKTDRNGCVTNVVFLNERLEPKTINGMAGYNAVFHENGNPSVKTFFDAKGVRRQCQYFSESGYNYAARFYSENGMPDEDCYELVECKDGGYSVLDANGEHRAYILAVDHVATGSVAEANGICPGDYLCAVDKITLEKQCGCLVARAIDSMRSSERVVVFSRKVGSNYRFMAVRCPPGPVGFFKKHMGLRFDDFTVLRNALLDWLKN